MANNKVIANSGNPFTAATDEIGGIDYAKMKLFSSTEDSVVPIGDIAVGSAAALMVSPVSDIVYPAAPVNSSGLTIATTAYAIGEVLGAGWTIPNAAKAAGGFGYVEKLDLYDLGDVTDVVTLHFFQESVTFGTDNAAPTISDTDIQKAVGRQIMQMVDMGGCRYGTLDSFAMRYSCIGSTNLYVYATTGTANAIFTAVTDLRLRVGLVRE